MNYHKFSTPPVFSVSTGAGLSNYFPMSEYQKCAVDDYFKKYDPGYPSYIYKGRDSIGANGGLYARGGRAFPDISANGAHMPVWTNGTFLAPGESGIFKSSEFNGMLLIPVRRHQSILTHRRLDDHVD
jgi:hypothetical protein